MLKEVVAWEPVNPNLFSFPLPKMPSMFKRTSVKKEILLSRHSGHVKEVSRSECVADCSPDLANRSPFNERFVTDIGVWSVGDVDAVAEMSSGDGEQCRVDVEEQRRAGVTEHTSRKWRDNAVTVAVIAKDNGVVVTADAYDGGVVAADVVAADVGKSVAADIVVCDDAEVISGTMGEEDVLLTAD